MADTKDSSSSSNLKKDDCRMYEKKYPDVEELVVVKVMNVAEMGAYVQLLEYGNIEGMILLSELSRRRIRSINKLIRVGRQEVVVVLRVDKERGYIDLSKRRVSPEDFQKAEEKYNKSKAVHSIMRHVASQTKLSMETLYQRFGWDLYKRFGHCYEAFQLMIKQPDQVLTPYNLEANIQDALLKMVRKRLTPQAIKIRADIELTCFAYDGIDAIKEALIAGEAKSTADTPIKVTLVAPPLYVINTTSFDKNVGISLLNEAIAVISEKIRSKKGDIRVKTEARAVTERDDKTLTLLMDTLGKQNQQVAADDEEDS